MTHLAVHPLIALFRPPRLTSPSPVAPGSPKSNTGTEHWSGTYLPRYR